MKTSANISRKMGDFEVIQRTKDGYFDANHLLRQWNEAHPKKRNRQIDRFLNSTKTKEFIEEIQTIENQHVPKSVDVDFQVVIRQKGRAKKNAGRTPDKVWMHPCLYIDFAMWLNPRFKYHVIQFVYDKFRQELIKISQHRGKNLVNAKELHEFLNVGKNFRAWIRDRIKDYGFVLNQDYVIAYYDYQGNFLYDSVSKHGQSDGQVHRKEYGLTVDTAKVISMVENNQQGRRARRYFIEVEKQWKTRPRNYSIQV